MIVALSRYVTLRPSEDGRGAVAAYVADGDVGLWVALPWLLTPPAIDEINELRATWSGALGAAPTTEGESAAALQLRLMKLSVVSRPELTPIQAADAILAATAPPPPSASPHAAPALLLPPLVLPDAASHYAAASPPELAPTPTATAQSAPTATETSAAPPAEAEEEAMHDAWDDDDGMLELLG